MAQASSSAEPATHGDGSHVWLPGVVQRISDFMDANEIACVLRLVNKATAAQFAGSRYAAVHLSQPVPPQAFALRWGRPGSMRALTSAQRRELVWLTAKSGSMANLQLLMDLPTGNVPLLREDMLTAAAGAGHLQMCVWLHTRGFPLSEMAADSAAKGGHQHVLEWLTANGCPWGEWIAVQAARGGHTSVLDWLLQRLPAAAKSGANAEAIFEACAEGCDVATLRRLHAQLLGAGWRAPPRARDQPLLLDYAAGSATPDWRHKIDFLRSLGFRFIHRGYGNIRRGIFKRADWQDRIDWLQQQGYPAKSFGAMAVEAADEGATDVLRHLLLGLGVGLEEDVIRMVASGAARSGSLEAVRLVCELYGVVNVGAGMLHPAAWGGHVPVLAWLVERLGPAAVLSADTFLEAAEFGCMEAMIWLRERGCPWDARAFTAAACRGSEAQLEWLVGQGCPMPTDGKPYLRAFCGDLVVLRCLKRLGCTWPPELDLFRFAVCCASGDPGAVELTLRWLLLNGCVPNWGTALGTAYKDSRDAPEVPRVVEKLRDEWYAINGQPEQPEPPVYSDDPEFSDEGYISSEDEDDPEEQ